MNIREQEYILAIAKHGDIKNAAQEMNISSPGLSVFLSSLEKNIGMPLFHRVGKKFVPTDAGKLYVGFAKKIAELRQEYEARLSDLKHGISGTIRIGLHPRRTTYLLPVSLKKLTTEYPDVRVEITEGVTAEMFDMLIAGELDFIIINRPHTNPVLTFEPLYRDRLVAVLSPAHPCAGKGVRVAGEKLEWLDLSLFNGEPFILQHPEQTSRMYTENALAYSGVKRGKTLVVKNLETASQFAAEGLGVAFNMKSYTRNFAYSKPVKYFLVGDLNHYVDYSVARRKDRYVPQYIRFFINAIKESMSDEEKLPGYGAVK